MFGVQCDAWEEKVLEMVVFWEVGERPENWLDIG